MAKAAKPLHGTPADTTQAVDQFMAALQHPCKAEVQALRGLMLKADAAIAEGIKWNAPSFRTTEYFATTHLRAKQGFSLVLHLGAKARALPKGGVAVKDPDKLLKWLGKDRAIVEFSSGADFAQKRGALQALVREWVAYV